MRTVQTWCCIHDAGEYHLPISFVEPPLLLWLRCELLLPSYTIRYTITVFLSIHFILLKRRYKILCPNQLKEPITPEKATEKILESTGLDAESFRLGKTKVEQPCYMSYSYIILYLHTYSSIINNKYLPMHDINIPISMYL